VLEACRTPHGAHELGTSSRRCSEGPVLRGHRQAFHQRRDRLFDVSMGPVVGPNGDVHHGDHSHDSRIAHAGDSAHARSFGLVGCSADAVAIASRCCHSDTVMPWWHTHSIRAWRLESRTAGGWRGGPGRYRGGFLRPPAFLSRICPVIGREMLRNDGRHLGDKIPVQLTFSMLPQVSECPCTGLLTHVSQVRILYAPPAQMRPWRSALVQGLAT
jgi:hypothetical protein